MAKGDKDEHKMLFDLRGRRRNVVKVVYAILAMLMAVSLLLVAGPIPFGDIFGSNDAANEAGKQFEEQAERVERKLAKEPDNADLLVSLTRTRVNAGNALVEQDPATGEIAITVESRQQLEKASAAWTEYLKATDEPNAGIAQIMSTALFSLAQTSRTGAEAEANIKAAAEAQEIVAETRPTLNSLSTLALYKLFAFDYAEAEKINEEAKKLATSKSQREQLDTQFEEVRKNAKKFEKQQEEISKASKGTGKETLENPLGAGLGGGATLAE